jgi:hypothetical protein
MTAEDAHDILKELDEARDEMNPLLFRDFKRALGTVIALHEKTDDLIKRLRNAETMRNAFVATSVAFATQEVDAFGQGSEAMRGTIAALVRALPIDPATMALIDFAITSAEVPRNA